MNLEEKGDLIFWIRDLRDIWDVTVLLVEHDMSLVMGISDRVMALNYGQVIAVGPPEKVQGHPEVLKAYLGEDERGRLCVLKVKNIETYYGPILAVRGVSMEVNEGSIATLLGANGAGKTTTLKTIMGLLDDQPDKGTIEFPRPAHRWQGPGNNCQDGPDLCSRRGARSSRN